MFSEKNQNILSPQKKPEQFIKTGNIMQFLE